MPLYLACVGAALGLEWFLASRESRWPGLALPAVNLLALHFGGSGAGQLYAHRR